MNASAWITAAFSSALGGFTALSLAMDRHFEDSFGRGRSPGRWLVWLRIAGTLGLLVSLLACLAAQGRSQGWVLYCGVLTAAALTVVGVLSYAPRHVVWLGFGGLVSMGAMLGWVAMG